MGTLYNAMQIIWTTLCYTSIWLKINCQEHAISQLLASSSDSVHAYFLHILYHTSQWLLMDINSQQQHNPQIINDLTWTSKLTQLQAAFNPWKWQTNDKFYRWNFPVHALSHLCFHIRDSVRRSQVAACVKQISSEGYRLLICTANGVVVSSEKLEKGIMLFFRNEA